MGNARVSDQGYFNALIITLSFLKELGLFKVDTTKILVEINP